MCDDTESFLCVEQLVERGSKLVLEQVVTTIATVADTAEEKFLHYYDRFMPSLKYVMQNALSSDYRMLRGKTIECISLIGLAVGKEKVSLHILMCYFLIKCISHQCVLLIRSVTHSPPGHLHL